VATLVFGVSCVAIPELALPLIGTASATASWARAAQAAGLLTTLTLLALVALDVAPSQSESRRRPGWVVTAALTVAGVGTVVLHTVHGLLPAIPTPEQSAVGHGAPVAASLILAGAWLLAGTACGARGLWQGRPLLTWTGLMLVALSVSYGGLAVADRPGHIWILGSALLRLSGLLVAVLGASLELERAFVDQRARLFDSELSARTNETRWQLHRARRRDRDHDLRSALVAIEGAALTLERHYDTLTDDERDRLTSMLSSGVDRLQSLVVDDSRPRASFALAEVVRPFVGNLMAEGESVAVEVPEDMVAVGSPAETAEVVRQLLDNARRRAPGGTITVRGEHDGGAIVLRVHGRGQDQEVPGIGRGASTAPGRALAEPSADLPMGLHVASRVGALLVRPLAPGACAGGGRGLRSGRGSQTGTRRAVLLHMGAGRGTVARSWRRSTATERGSRSTSSRRLQWGPSRPVRTGHGTCSSWRTMSCWPRAWPWRCAGRGWRSPSRPGPRPRPCSRRASACDRRSPSST